MAARLSVQSVFTIAVCFVGHAEAHEPPFGTGVYASGAALVLRMSRGLVLRSSERLEYRLLCNEALGVAEYDTPSVLLREDGSLLVGTSTGLRHVSADGCEITPSQALGDGRVSALVHDPNDSSHVYAATDLGFYESRDHGEHFELLDEHVFDSLEVPEGAEAVVFAAGKLGAPGHVQAYIARWHGAAPLELQELALEQNEYGVALLGSDGDHVVAVARAYLGTQYPDRFLVSTDGARSWQSPISAPGIAACAVDARHGAWIVGDATGLWRMSTSGEPTAQLGTAAVSCLAQAGSRLFICDGAGAEGGVSLSADGGEHARSLLRWNQITGLAACAADAPSVQQCQVAWEDWRRELLPGAPLLKDELHGLPDTGNTLNGASPSSGCAAVGGSHFTGVPLWLALLFMLITRRLQAKRSYP
jgi:hypothetical protein